MSTPQRIQLRRTKGWRKPEGAVVVSRPSKWGNPFRLADYPRMVPTLDGEGFVRLSEYQRREFAVNDFEAFLSDAIDHPWSHPHEITFRIIAESLDELTGRDLACWCPLDQPCHADVLLELANTQARPVPLPGRSPDPAHRSGEQHRKDEGRTT